MGLSWGSDRLHVARLRVHSRARDPLATRVRVSAMLSSATLTPPGLAPAAILIVRRLQDPLPGRMAAAGGSWWLSPEWTGAVRAHMAGLMRQAARPLHGAVEDAAAAVLFDDEAELSACLVRDWLQGRVGQRWWWTSVLAGLAPAQWLEQRVLSRGELFVPTTALLARHGLAVAWLTRLEDVQVEQVLVGIARSHALPPALAPGARPEVQRVPAPPAPERIAAGVSAQAASAGRTSVPPNAALARLVQLVPEALAPALRPAQRRLLAVALALARAPAWARTPQLARAVDALDRHALAYALRLPPQLGADEPTTEEPPPLAFDRGRDGSADTGASLTSTPHAQHLPRAEQAPGLVAWRPDGGAGVDASPWPPAPSTRPALGIAADVAHALPVPTTAGQPAPLQLPERVEPGASATPAPELAHTLRVPTAFGGIFYLLNAALAMGWYSDFSAPRGPNLKLSPWDWLALVGRAWFPRSFARDPVAGLLAQLAGREARALRRPRGFQAQLDALHTRLQQALGAEGDVAARVCRHCAEVAVTPTRVDVHLALAELPLALRTAGLDRDPGWIPAAGRALAFHFE